MNKNSSTRVSYAEITQICNENDAWMNVFSQVKDARTPNFTPTLTHLPWHTHLNHKRPITPGELSPSVRTCYNSSYRSTQRTSGLKRPVHRQHFICPYNSGLPQLTSVMSFHTPAGGGGRRRKCWHGHLSHEFQPSDGESADAANCVWRKSWQRSEIKCQLLRRPWNYSTALIFHACFCIFLIYLLSDLMTRQIKRTKGVENIKLLFFS